MSLDVRLSRSIAPGDEVDAAMRLDRASDVYLQRVSPIILHVAETEAERRDAFSLRYEAIVDQGWERPEAFPEGIEREELDDHATHVVGWLNGQAVANTRVILPQPGRLLPVERDFGIRIEPFGSVAELDRTCTSRQTIVRADTLLLALVSACWQEVRRAGFSTITGRLSPGMLRLYRAVGIEHDILGPAQVSWNEERYPVRFSATNATERFYDRLERLSR
ncbi:hypothetical protein BH20CHL4_BH20CHL4_15340 [soil metagenome]